MSSDCAVSVRGLSKAYTIAHSAEKHSTLAETLLHRLRRPWGRAQRETFWALQDVSFEIQRGDVVGIIGRNGAGKSTLLKILSRITEPTTGQIDLYGRVGSLLEVGTGFHPELTGRENIYLNGQILGMRKKEIERQFDAIVDFAEIDKFLDTPVKRYSSGMYVRLAFAVAAHLNTEILIVDEVLAVGDMQFQKKCLGKMSEVSRSEGRTVLFVSHSMLAVSQLCRRVVCLAEGRVVQDGSPEAVIAAYTRRLGTGRLAVRHEDLAVTAEFLNSDGQPLSAWRANSELLVRVRLKCEQPLASPAIDLAFYSPSGAKVFAVQSDRANPGTAAYPVTDSMFEFRIRNTGIVCPELSVDLGVRGNKELSYRVWWERVETLSTSVFSATDHVVPDMLVHLPTTVQAVPWEKVDRVVQDAATT